MNTSVLKDDSTAAMDAAPGDVWAIVDQMLSQVSTVREQVAAYQIEQERKRAEARVEQERRKVEFLAQQEQKRLEREEAARKAVERANNIVWNAEGKAVVELLDALQIVSGDEQDSRFANWAKEVTSITSDETGYGFEGKWVNAGSVEVERKVHVYLLASTSGSRKNQTTTYRVVLMNADGKLERTDITTTNKTPGWALRIRDRVAALLAK